MRGCAACERSYLLLFVTNKAAFGRQLLIPTRPHACIYFRITSMLSPTRKRQGQGARASVPAKIHFDFTAMHPPQRKGRQLSRIRDPPPPLLRRAQSLLSAPLRTRRTVSHTASHGGEEEGAWKSIRSPLLSASLEGSKSGGEAEVERRCREPDHNVARPCA